VAVIAFALSGCAGISEVASGDVKLFKPSNPFEKPAWAAVESSGMATTRRALTPNDLVGADGSCAGVPVAAAADPGSSDANAAPAAAALVPGGIGIDMTECEVVQRAGHPENFEVGSNQRGERSLVLTYIRGPKPGIYRFEGGRLVTMERGPEPPPAPKPAKPAKQPAKPAARRA
jgi:hypothetical protein